MAKKVKEPDVRSSEEKIAALFDSFSEAISTAATSEGLSLGIEADAAKRTLTVDLLPEEREEIGAESIELSVPTTYVLEAKQDKDKQYGLPFFDFLGSDSKVSVAKVYEDRIDEKLEKATEKVVKRVIPFAKAHTAAAREELGKCRESLEAVKESSDAPMSLITDGKAVVGTSHTGSAKITRVMDAGARTFRVVRIEGELTAEQVKSIEALL